ncbi:DNA repair protein RecO [Candidatus Sumerlaeota bacterium]|nr:DNA repair protein RecO [Candidatus Sumerlaeota bacterium]
MSLFNDEGFVITRSEWKESSLIVRFFTREHGKLNFMAKGIRRAKTRIGSFLDSFSRVKIIYYLKQGNDLASLKEAFTINLYPSLRADLRRFAAVSFYFEILDIGLAPHERHEDIFSLTSEFLDTIDKPEWVAESLPWYFLEIAGRLGYAPRLEKCFVCGTSQNLAHFDLDAGQCVCQNCRKDSEKVIPMPQYLASEIKGGVSNEGGSIALPSHALPDFFHFMKDFLEYRFEKRIKSGDFLITQMA